MTYVNYLLKTPVLLLLLLTLTACGGGDGGGNASGPSVTATTPAEGTTGVLTNSALTFTFDKDIDPTTLTNATMTLAGSKTVAGTLTYDATTRTATFTPDAELKPGSAHTASLTTRITDLAGNGLASVFQLQFITEPFIRRVSVDSAGQEATGDSLDPAISADGRYIVFYSYATNLVSGDTNNLSDIFRHDTQTGTTNRLNLNETGQQASNDDSSFPAISANGRYVVFVSDDTNLAPGGDTNTTSDIFRV